MVTMIKSQTISEKQTLTGKDVTVVTHTGSFGMDEVFSVALLQLFQKQIKLLRSDDVNILKKALGNPEIYVLATGGVYSPEKRNFDGRLTEISQNDTVFQLVFRHLFPYYETDKALKRVYEQFGCYQNTPKDTVSKKTEYDTSPCTGLSDIFRHFNRMEDDKQDYQFIKAVKFAYQIIGNEIHAATAFNESEKVWQNLQEVQAETALLEAYCPHWKALNGMATKMYKYVIQPKGGHWSVMSYEPSLYPLPGPSIDDKDMLLRQKDGAQVDFESLAQAMRYVKQYLFNH